MTDEPEHQIITPLKKTLAQIMNTPVQLLTEEEIAQLDPKSQIWAKNCQHIAKREAECPGHEPEYLSSPGQSMRGWHRQKCKHCGMDMSYDSGD